MERHALAHNLEHFFCNLRPNPKPPCRTLARMSLLVWSHARVEALADLVKSIPVCI